MLINYRSIDGRYDAVKCETEGVGIEHFIAKFAQNRTALEISNEFGIALTNLNRLRYSSTWLHKVIDYQITRRPNKTFVQLGYLG